MRTGWCCLLLVSCPFLPWGRPPPLFYPLNTHSSTLVAMFTWAVHMHRRSIRIMALTVVREYVDCLMQAPKANNRDWKVAKAHMYAWLFVVLRSYTHGRYVRTHIWP